MATRSFVAIKTGDNTFDAIYVHSDGYPEARLPLLENHYNTQEGVNELIGMGDCSVLRETLKDSFFYHRDRNEPLHIYRNLPLEKLLKRAENTCAEYVYIFVANKWIVQSL